MVAFALVPVFGLFLNTLFVSYIELAKKSILKSLLRLLLFALILNSLFFLLKPVGVVLVSNLYGFNELLSEHFYYSVEIGLIPK